MKRDSRSLAELVKKLRVLPGISLVGKKKPLSELTERELIQLESEIGRELFGSVPSGHRREFFNTNPHTWIWHEEWKDSSGKSQQLTTKYDIRDDGIWKTLPGPRYLKVEGEELQNFVLAARLYHERVMREIYGRDPATEKKLL